MSNVHRFPIKSTRAPSKPANGLDIAQSIAKAVHSAMELALVGLPDAKGREEMRLLRNVIEVTRSAGLREIAELHQFYVTRLIEEDRNA